MNVTLQPGCQEDCCLLDHKQAAVFGSWDLAHMLSKPKYASNVRSCQQWLRKQEPASAVLPGLVLLHDLAYVLYWAGRARTASTSTAGSFYFSKARFPSMAAQ